MELGAVPYSQLHQVYRECSMYVAPAYAELFAHPLVEAMASGLPVVAADSAVHREICQDAALYFPRFWGKNWPTGLPDRAFRWTVEYAFGPGTREVACLLLE